MNDMNAEPAQERYVRLDEPQLVSRWCELLRCSERELRGAIASVGNDSRLVRDFFGKARRNSHRPRQC
jgi:hypothetical protein